MSASVYVTGVYSSGERETGACEDTKIHRGQPSRHLDDTNGHLDLATDGSTQVLNGIKKSARSGTNLVPLKIATSDAGVGCLSAHRERGHRLPNKA